MATAKVVSLNVRPLQASHLCFEVGGILGESNTELGAPVAAFDFAAFYATLGSFPTVAGDLSRLLFDALEIQGFVKPSTLVALRAEAGKAVLNNAINARQNAYFAKYGNAPDIITLMNESYSPAIGGTKPLRLGALSTLAKQQEAQLSAAYIKDKRTGVVKSTNSLLDSTLDSTGGSTTTGHRAGKSDGKSDQVTAEFPVIQATFPPPAPGSPGAAGTISGRDPFTEDFQEGLTTETSSEDSSDKSTSTGSATEHQTIVNTDYGYRIPFLECQAQNERAQISLIDESFAQFMFSQNLPNLEQVFRNELNSIDSDIFRLQVAYLNTVLMSPISGTVTGIYKNPGDMVKAGEPVIRVENNAEILLVATLIFRGPISIGSNVKVETTLFDLSGPPTSIGGAVVAVRGQREDNQWEVIVQCKNLRGGNPIFPLGYHFDYDDTKVDIS